MVDVVLMPNKKIGLNIAKYLKDNGDNIVAVFFAEEDEDYIKEFSGLYDPEECQIHIGYKTHEDASIVQNLPSFDFLVTVYWPFLIGDEFLNKTADNLIGKPLLSRIASRSVNFHPALLPINRGWYPHVHSILDGSPFGVTLHVIEKGADTGPVWAQKEIKMPTSMTAGEIHAQLSWEMERLFIETWPEISAGKIDPSHQDHTKAVYHSKGELDGIDELDLLSNVTIGNLINLLRARTFHDRGFSYFIDENGDRIYLHLRMNKTGIF